MFYLSVVSYEEKGKWVYILSSVGAYVAYVAVILNRANGKPLSDVAYVSPMLWSIGIAIGVSIVGRIIVEIAKPSETHKLDQRDRDVHRFGEYIGGSVLALAMLLPFGLSLAAAEHFWISNAMYLAFFLSMLASTGTQLVAYRRGL